MTTTTLPNYVLNSATWLDLTAARSDLVSVALTLQPVSGQVEFICLASGTPSSESEQGNYLGTLEAADVNSAKIFVRGKATLAFLKVT